MIFVLHSPLASETPAGSLVIQQACKSLRTRDWKTQSDHINESVKGRKVSFFSDGGVKVSSSSVHGPGEQHRFVMEVVVSVQTGCTPKTRQHLRQTSVLCRKLQVPSEVLMQVKYE